MTSPAVPLSLLLLFAILSNTFADPDPLQDTCVADLSSGVTINGFVCKPSNNVSANDFFFDGLKNPGLINNSLGSLVTAANVLKIPGLNTLGVSLARVDYAPGGVNPPHTHPRATEIVFVLEGELEGLVHFQINNGVGNASVLAAFNSQLPGTQAIALTLFAASPPVPDNVLAKAFQIGTMEVDNIKSGLAPKK
ncbi:hypothetical protein GIB67_001147 [Kingdonia uniflora]|uniref:Cupin type-1 domain-containing protein n=1 Tax=Kingdonia uniflora TaxID=39325 RepID=A0A7J7MML2_9MAGN|nr:hypothetical protein GIB67_001147 [Kingdonia uniflora]